ncbi:MAG TPA: glycosyltransferase [Bacteroidetes bacterium]|nr:glycosyltransferase [Bacteroidota bacterium]
MTVCDLTHAYHPTSGGIRTFIDLKRRYLLEHTPHRHVLIVPGERDEVEQGDRWTTIRIRSPLLPGGSTYRVFTSPGLVRDALEMTSPDVVELNTYYMPQEYRPAFAYRNAARAAGREVAAGVHYHTDFADSYVAAYTGPLSGALTPLARRYVRRILKRADFAMTLAPMFVEQLAGFGVEDVELVPQFVDLDLFHPTKASAAMRERAGAGPDDLLMAYLGRFDSEKHVDTLVEMVRQLPAEPRPVLFMAGAGPDREKLEAAASQTDRLVVSPYLQGKDDVATLLASADVYVTAGPHEVAAFSVVEAQAAGLPVVGVDAGGLRDRVHDGLGYLVPVDDAAAMAQRVSEAYRQRAAMGTRVREYVEKHYSWTRCYAQVVAAYERALVSA